VDLRVADNVVKQFAHPTRMSRQTKCAINVRGFRVSKHRAIESRTKNNQAVGAQPLPMKIAAAGEM
jgi:hypothetical protein